MLESLLSCDAIHLSGGNPYYFLHWLRERKMILPLRRYVEQGGVLIGVCAGSMLMSPDISICPLYGKELIEVEHDFSALNLVDFAFAPHYRDREMSPSTKVLQKYSLDNQIVVYTCRDSGGVVVIGDNVKCIGDVVKVYEK